MNVGPWNWAEHALDPPDSDEGPRIDGAPIVFVHYHGMRQRSDGSLDWEPGGYLIGDGPRHALLPTYETALRSALDSVRALRPEFAAGIASSPTVSRRAQRALLTTASRLRRRFPQLVKLQSGLAGRMR